MRATIEKLFDTVRILYRVQRDDISYGELIRFFYDETPPADHGFLRYDYRPYVNKVSELGPRNERPSFSVIIPTYNRSYIVGGAINSILRQTGIRPEDYEIIVVDNGSKDVTEEVLTNFGGKTPASIIYIKLRANYGADFARNIAVLHSRGRLLAFTDDDCIVPPDWLFEFKRELEADPEIAAVGGFKIPRYTGEHLDIYHRFLMWGHFSPPHVRTKELAILRNRCGLTANVCYRRDAFEKAGGFNIYFKHVGFEEFKIRIRKLGLVLLYEPRMVEHFADFTFSIHVRKLLAQGWDWYLLHKLHPQIRADTSFLFFLKKTAMEIKTIARSQPMFSLFNKSFRDIITFSLLSLVTNLSLWFGQYWVLLKMFGNPSFASHDTLF